MIKDTVVRPRASDKKIRTSDDFELCYLRHQYFRRVKYNPTKEEMRPYMFIVERLTKNTFFTYFNLFKAVGMYHEDILNIGRVHLVSFLGLYSLEKMENKKEIFIDLTIRNKYRVPGQKDFDQKNKANFTMFFKQRMEDLVRVCRQKVRNIKGTSYKEFSVFYGKEKPPKNPRKLIREYEKFGYKKIDFSVFKSIRKKANVDNNASLFEFNGFWYAAIAMEHQNLELEDLIGSEYNPYDNAHNMQPDDLYAEKETKDFKMLFNKNSDCGKRVILRNFIENNKYKRYYKKEIVAAKKLLRKLGD